MKQNAFLGCAAMAAGMLVFGRAALARNVCIDPNPSTGASLAVVVDAAPLAHTAQLLPLNERGQIVGKGDVHRQAEHVLAAIDTALRNANSGLADTVKLNVCVSRAELTAAVSSVLAIRFSGDVKPAVSFVGGELAHPDALVAMDAVAVSRTAPAGAAPVHFSGARAGFSDVTVLPATGVVYVAGMADRAELGPATTTTMAKIESAIAHLGLKREDIVQLKAFLRPMAQVRDAERAIAEFFEGAMVPPVVYIEWISPGPPIEIEAIVAAPARASARSVTHHTPPGSTRSSVFSRLAQIHSGKRIYISGLYGSSEPERDVVEIFRQLDALIERTGSSRDHLAKATYYFSDPKSNARLDAFRPGYYDPATPPAASKARVPNVGLPGRGIMIDMIAGTK